MKYLTLEKVTPREARRIRLIMLLTGGFALLTALFPYPDVVKYYLYNTGFFTHETSACFFLNAFHVPCAFCGVSRALRELISLNLAGSIYYNPSAFLVYPAAAFISGGVFLLSLKNYKVKIAYGKTFWLAATAVFALIWIINVLWGHP